MLTKLNKALIKISISRLIDGVALAAAYGSIVSLLMVIYPNHTGLIVSSVEGFFGVGLTFGKSINSMCLLCDSMSFNPQQLLRLTLYDCL